MTEIETEDWTIFFMKGPESRMDERVIDLRFRFKSNNFNQGQLNEAINILKKDFNDLGKWRKFKELKKDLENE